MKRTWKLFITTCLLLLAVCGAAFTADAKSYYYRGTITIDPSFPDSKFDANEEIKIPLTVRRYLSNNTTDYLSKYYCDVYGPTGTRISSNYGYLSDMNYSTLNWTIFDNHTPRALGEYTVKYYTSNDDGGICHFYVTSVSGKSGSLKWVYYNDSQKLEVSGTGSIPSTAPWNRYENSIQTVVIGEGITSISKNAFRRYTMLTSVKLPGTLTMIGEYAFNDCQNLTTINFPGRLTKINGYAFKDCSSLQNVKLPSSLRLLGECVFKGSGIKKVDIPSGIVSLPYGIFAECYSLESISIPVTVKKIEYCAFDDSMSLKTVIYGGTRTQWNSMSIDSYGNSALLSASIRYKVVLAQVKLKSLENAAGGIKVTWNKVSGAQGYYIYRKTGTKSWERVATVRGGTTVSYTDKKSLANGTQYSYMVKAYNGSTVSSGTTLTTLRIGATVITSCAGNPKSITLQWKKNTKVTGYEIKYTTGTSSKILKLRSRDTVKYTIKNLVKGKTYTVCMRGYRVLNGKTYYSAWSSAKKAVAR